MPGGASEGIWISGTDRIRADAFDSANDHLADTPAAAALAS